MTLASKRGCRSSAALVGVQGLCLDRRQSRTDAESLVCCSRAVLPRDADCVPLLQIIHFLKLDPGPLADLVYACALLCGSTQHSESSAQALELLRTNPDIAETVLTAPCARRGTTPLSLPQLSTALLGSPNELCTAGGARFFRHQRNRVAA